MIRVHEPVTALTDYGLAVLAGVLAVWLVELPGTAAVVWAASFAFAALAATLAGTSHGFGPSLPARSAIALWRAALLATIGAGTLVLAASASVCLAPGARLAVIAAATAKSFAAALWTWREPQFGRAVTSYALDLAAVLILQSYRWNLPGSGWVVAAIAVSAVAAVVQTSRLALHRSFNHNDLYHLVQAAALYLLYRGAAVLLSC